MSHEPTEAELRACAVLACDLLDLLNSHTGRVAVAALSLAVPIILTENITKETRIGLATTLVEQIAHAVTANVYRGEKLQGDEHFEAERSRRTSQLDAAIDNGKALPELLDVIWTGLDGLTMPTATAIDRLILHKGLLPMAKSSATTAVALLMPMVRDGWIDLNTHSMPTTVTITPEGMKRRRAWQLAQAAKDAQPPTAPA